MTALRWHGFGRRLRRRINEVTGDREKKARLRACRRGCRGNTDLDQRLTGGITCRLRSRPCPCRSFCLCSRCRRYGSRPGPCTSSCLCRSAWPWRCHLRTRSSWMCRNYHFRFYSRADWLRPRRQDRSWQRRREYELSERAFDAPSNKQNPLGQPATWLGSHFITPTGMNCELFLSASGSNTGYTGEQTNWMCADRLGLSPMQDRETDLVVIGAGPIGLELAVAAAKRIMVLITFTSTRNRSATRSRGLRRRRGFSARVNESPPPSPGCRRKRRINPRRRARSIWRICGAWCSSSICKSRRIVLWWGLGKTRRRICRDRLNRLADDSGACVARRIVLCTGGTDRPRRLNVYCRRESAARQPLFSGSARTYFRKRLLVVVGGKNSAVETALRCHQAGAKVALSYRRGQLDSRSIKYWLLPEINGLIQDKRIAGHFESTPEVEITSSHVPAESLRMEKKSRWKPIFVLLQIGFQQDTTLLELAGVELNGSCRTRPPLMIRRWRQTVSGHLRCRGRRWAARRTSYRVFIENCHVHSWIGLWPPLQGRHLRSPPLHWPFRKADVP